MSTDLRAVPQAFADPPSRSLLVRALAGETLALERLTGVTAMRLT